MNSDKYRITVRPEPVEGLRQAQPERLGVMIYENVNKQGAADTATDTAGEHDGMEDLEVAKAHGFLLTRFFEPFRMMVCADFRRPNKMARIPSCNVQRLDDLRRVPGDEG